MQDTNPLQWKLIEPLRRHVTLYCVGDDAQSIYGFRGADFRNVHQFSDRVEGSVTLRLEDELPVDPGNCRHTQLALGEKPTEILKNSLEQSAARDASRLSIRSRTTGRKLTGY